MIAGLTLGTERALIWMESPEFCASCHTMEGEVAAHARSPHQTVECTECHTRKGLDVFIESKWDGMQQTVKLLTGTYPRPIEPTAHGMPPASETCLRCHNPARERGELLITRVHYQDDKDNTEQRVALVVRFSDNPERETAGVHWHVLSTVEYLTQGEEGQVIDWIGVERTDGSREEFIRQDVVEISEQAGERAAELRLNGETRRMTCYDCHNRVGHTYQTPRRAIDEAMTDGRIDSTTPYVKKLGLQVISKQYDSLEEAGRAFNELGNTYHRRFPNLFLEQPDSLQEALGALAQIYRETADPEMQAFSETYPSYLGHTDSAGCFRRHDGGHYKIEEGRLSEETIPSRCSLCHTFPSVGERAPNVMLGPAPSSHTDRLWVFEHKDETPSLDPARSSCSECHSQTYCANCHSTRTIAITHDNIYFEHAAVIKETTDQPCSYCHQKPFCERCHEEGIDW